MALAPIFNAPVPQFITVELAAVPLPMVTVLPALAAVPIEIALSVASVPAEKVPPLKVTLATRTSLLKPFIVGINYSFKLVRDFP
jgi:hypothetical protein